MISKVPSDFKICVCAALRPLPPGRPRETLGKAQTWGAGYVCVGVEGGVMHSQDPLLRPGCVSVKTGTFLTRTDLCGSWKAAPRTGCPPSYYEHKYVCGASHPASLHVHGRGLRDTSAEEVSSEAHEWRGAKDRTLPGHGISSQNQSKRFLTVHPSRRQPR